MNEQFFFCLLAEFLLQLFGQGPLLPLGWFSNNLNGNTYQWWDHPNENIVLDLYNMYNYKNNKVVGSYTCEVHFSLLLSL